MKITMLGGEDQITEGRPKKEPSHAERTVARAHESKVRATGDWVDGHIDSKKHADIHKRADKVIACKGKMK